MYVVCFVKREFLKMIYCFETETLTTERNLLFLVCAQTQCARNYDISVLFCVYLFIPLDSRIDVA